MPLVMSYVSLKPALDALTQGKDSFSNQKGQFCGLILASEKRPGEMRGVQGEPKHQDLCVWSFWVQMGCAGLNLTEPGLRTDFGNTEWGGHSLSSSLPPQSPKGHSELL